MSLLKDGGSKANYEDVETGERYWISGCRRDGADRLYGEALPVEIDDDVREDYFFKGPEMPATAAVGVPSPHVL